MRITVISDSHKSDHTVRRILEEREDSKHIFFLGDVTPDIEDMNLEFPDKNFYIVSGNCDYFSSFPSSDMETIGGKRIFYTHGHTLGVKHGTERLLETAKQLNCNIALFGHTHTSQILYEDGIYLVNPGSCSQPRDSHKSYAVIDIEENGIMPIIINI